MNNLSQRILTATIGAAIMIGGMLWNVYSFCAVLFILSSAVHYEYMSSTQHLKEGKKRPGEWILVLFTGMFIFLVTSAILSTLFDHELHYFLIFILPLIISFFIYELFAGRSNPFQNIGLNVVGLFYCVLPFLLLCILGLTYLNEEPSNRNYQPMLILGYFFIVWSNDVFAYFAGKAFGKHKLFERISPNKTWEGFFGGMIAALACSVGLSYFIDFLSLTDWLGIGFIVAVFGTLGDLIESMLKRSLHLKDSSSILPGHGGFLDRFDATLIAAPIVFVWLMIRI